MHWVAAARLFDVAAIGLTSALVSTMFLIATVANMGMGLGLAYILPGAQQRWAAIVNAVLLAVGLLAALFSLLVAAGAAASHMEIGAIARSASGVLVFVGTCTMWGTGFVLDQIFTIENATSLALLRNALFSVVRLLLLIATTSIASTASADAPPACWLAGGSVRSCRRFWSPSSSSAPTHSGAASRGRSTLARYMT